MLAELRCALASEIEHVFFRAKVQAAGGTRLDARGLESLADAVGAQRALEHAMRLGIHLWNIERATRDAVAAPDAIRLLKIHDAIRVLHNGAIRGAGCQASRFGAVHALVLAHQPHQRAVFAFVFVEEDQIPVIPARFRHGLVAVAENGFAERQVVPLHASDFASLAADAGRGVYEFADGVFLALSVFTGDAPGMA